MNLSTVKCMVPGPGHQGDKTHFPPPATLCHSFRFSQFPPLHFGAVVSFLAISTPAFLTVPLFHVSHFQSIPETCVFRMCVYIALCTAVAHNTAQNRPDNFPLSLQSIIMLR